MGSIFASGFAVTLGDSNTAPGSPISISHEDRQRVLAPPRRALRGTIAPPGDKSISHRALILGAIATGESLITGLNPGEDVGRTRRALAALGVRVRSRGATIVVGGRAGRLDRPAGAIDCGNAGTTMRLLAGVLAAQPFPSVLTGDASLSRRPMDRVAAPLREMGARVETTGGGAPVRVEGSALEGIEHASDVASAQVKSAVLLAGLFAKGPTRVVEPHRSRDHTERLLVRMGAALESFDTAAGWAVRLTPGATLGPLEIRVPGDPSAAAFHAVAATIVPGSEVRIRGVGANPTRTGFLAVLARMGASITVEPAGEAAGEPLVDLVVRARELRGTEIEPEEIPSLVDELPILAIAAATAHGATTVRGAGEIRVKESDRIEGLALGLRALGVAFATDGDGFVVGGGGFRRGGVLDAGGDHRLAMSFAVARLVAPEPVEVRGSETHGISDPGFAHGLARLST